MPARRAEGGGGRSDLYGPRQLHTRAGSAPHPNPEHARPLTPTPISPPRGLPGSSLGWWGKLRLREAKLLIMQGWRGRSESPPLSSSVPGPPLRGRATRGVPDRLPRPTAHHPIIIFAFILSGASRQLIVQKPSGTLRVKEIRGLSAVPAPVNSGSFTQVQPADRGCLLRAQRAEHLA